MGAKTKPPADMHVPSSKDTSTVPSGAPEKSLVSHNFPASAQLSGTPVPEHKQNDNITGYTVQNEGPEFMREIPVMDGNAISFEESDVKPYTTFSVSAGELIIILIEIPSMTYGIKL